MLGWEGVTTAVDSEGIVMVTVVYNPMRYPRFSADKLFSNCFRCRVLESFTSKFLEVRFYLSVVVSTPHKLLGEATQKVNTLEVLIDLVELFVMD